jgi:2,5-diketo-D-gluconate reductase B
MILVAYSPLARGQVKDIPELGEISKKYSVSKEQVTLAWLLSYDNVVVIPKATSEEHIRANFESMNIILDREDIEKIEALDIQKLLAVPPDHPNC